jgi:hypothetical protein
MAAKALGSDRTEISFTASGTEAVNLALFGAARAARPSACGLDGLPEGTLRRASATSLRTGAEPASSR